MPRSKKFKDLVQHHVKADKKFAEALLREGIDAMLSGDVETGKSLLRDTIKATVGFETARQGDRRAGQEPDPHVRPARQSAGEESLQPSSAICKRRPACICGWRLRAEESGLADLSAVPRKGEGGRRNPPGARKDGGLRGACHRAALCADPLANPPYGLKGFQSSTPNA